MLKCVTGRVQGFSHEQRNQPCQDAYKVYREDDRIVMALADGHGSSIHRYSADGSRIAVDTAVDILKEMLFSDNPRECVKENLDTLAGKIELEWKKRVKEFHYSLVKKGERQMVFDATKNKPSVENTFSLNVLYGTTLLAVLYERDFLLALQIGDGDMAYVDDGGNCGRLIEEEAQVGSATNSLCMVSSEQYFRLKMVDYEEDFHPALVFLATDGYSNSYRTDEDFLKLVGEYAEIFANYDEKTISNAIEGWLAETSKLGSGDDITVGIIFRAAGEQQA